MRTAIVLNVMGARVFGGPGPFFPTTTISAFEGWAVWEQLSANEELYGLGQQPPVDWEPSAPQPEPAKPALSLVTRTTDPDIVR